MGLVRWGAGENFSAIGLTRLEGEEEVEEEEVGE